MQVCSWNNFDLLSKKISKELKKNSKVIEPFFLGLIDNPADSKLTSEIFVKDKYQNLLKFNQ